MKSKENIFDLENAGDDFGEANNLAGIRDTDDLKEIPLDIGRSGQSDIEKILSENGFMNLI